MTKKTRVDADLRREMILEAALEVFANKGLSATTKELAASAGVSEALLYKYFNSKDELFAEVKNHCCAQVHQYAEKIETVETPCERLAVSALLLSYTILIGFPEDKISKEQMLKMMLHSLSGEGDFAVQMFSNFGRWVPVISADMEECRQEGCITKTESSDETLLWMVHHFILGIALTRSPKKHLEIFDVDSKKLVFETSVQALVMLGAPHATAQEAIEKAFNDKNQIETFNFLKG